jgi:hypothetical protein
MKKDVKEKSISPAPLRDAGVVTYIQPHLIPHLILRGVIGLVALARRTFPRRCQPQLLVPTRRFHEVSGARRRSVPKLRTLSVGLSANHDPTCIVHLALRFVQFSTSIFFSYTVSSSTEWRGCIPHFICQK